MFEGETNFSTDRKIGYELLMLRLTCIVLGLFILLYSMLLLGIIRRLRSAMEYEYVK